MTITTTLRQPLLLLPILLVIGLASAWAQPGQGRQALRAHVGSGELFDRPEVKEKLGLTDEQVTAIKNGQEEAKRANIELDAQMQLLQLDLKKAMDADEVDEKAVGEIAKKIGEVHGKLLANNLKQRLIVKETLTDEQKEKAREAIRERAETWREKRGEARERGAYQRGPRDGQHGPADGDRHPLMRQRSDMGQGFGPQAQKFGPGAGEGFRGFGDDGPARFDRRGPRPGFNPGAPPADAPKPVDDAELDDSM